MDSSKKTVEVNVILLIALILILLSWLGLFRETEFWLANGEWVTIQIDQSTCVDGSSRENYHLTPCELVTFKSLETNKIIRGDCVRACQQQIGHLFPGVRYRIITTEFPIVGKRILKIERYD